MATSKQCDPVNLCMAAAAKGLQLVGTGDFTHPGWRDELRESLVEDGQGLLRLRDERIAELPAGMPGLDPRSVRFVLSAEISSIYKRAGKTRKVHNLVMVPTLDDADRISARLDEIGNIRADGRPILGLDSRDLLEICLEECAGCMFIPAHIWTPHFSLFGANSGFDSIEECFEDLSSHIIAVETGLSSDPPMNWRLSALDRFALMSNSDAHSPANLAREANLFDCDFSYAGVRGALTDRGKGFIGTIEFFPEEGKYHYDGHRKCGIRWSPAEARANDGICPVCGRPVTLGVLHRVEMLADRAENTRPAAARHYESLVPLSSIIAAALGVGAGTVAVARVQSSLTKALGPELGILRAAPLDLIRRHGGELVAEGIRRVREGRLTIVPGYDGEYGKVQVFTDAERRELVGEAKLFEVPSTSDARARAGLKTDRGEGLDEEAVAVDLSCLPSLLDLGTEMPEEDGSSPGLNCQQLDAATIESGTIIVAAGPGTGKTRTLTCRVRALVDRGVDPACITAVTFTRKAAAEISDRLASMLAPDKTSPSVHVGTFHSICMRILKSIPDLCNLTVIDESDRLLALEEALRNSGAGGRISVSDLSRAISLLKTRCVHPGASAISPALAQAYQEYEAALQRWNCLDYDDVILRTIEQWSLNAGVQERYSRWFRHLLIDEFQDVNEAQYQLVRLWSAGSESLFVIGDPDQSIYEFRGSDPRFFTALAGEAASVRSVSLLDSYRSQRIIAAAASVVISNNSGERGDLRTTRSSSWPVVAVECPSDLSEAIAVAQEIERLVGGTSMLQAHERYEMLAGSDVESTYSFSDIAVLFRTGRQGDLLEECLTKAGIPYRVAGKKEARMSPEVEEILTVLKLSAEPESAFRWLRCLRLPRYGLSDRGLRRAARTLIGAGVQPDEAARRLAQDTLLSADDRRGVSLLIDDLTAIGQPWRETSPREFIQHCAETTQRRWTIELQRLLAVADGYGDVNAMLQDILFGKDADWVRLGYGRPEAEHVSLMTIHAAKGLEFGVVFVTGCEEGLLPLIRTDGGRRTIEEERRLFYVAMTRAKDLLYLTHAERRTRHFGGPDEVRERSRFIAEIPTECLKLVSLHPRKPERAADRQASLF
jgi:uncharacterized protein (TIGR00375 family)